MYSGFWDICFNAFLFGMVGALVSKTEDISKSSGVVTFLYLASFLITMYGLTSPDSLLVKAASYIPFTSSNAMQLRASMGTVGTWEIALSMAFLAVSCIQAGNAGGGGVPVRNSPVRKSH